MELTTLIGVVIGVLAIIGAMIFKHISFSVFINPAAILIIFVGTAASVLNAFPGSVLKKTGVLFKIIFTKQKGITETDIIRLMIELSAVAKKDGLLALEKKVEEIEEPFIKKGVRMVVDGIQGDVIEEILESEIRAMEKRHDIHASIFSSAGMYAPTLGVLGAVFGLIAAMASIDDTALMSEAIAAAFIATILGIFTGYVLWSPFSKKLKVKSQNEVMIKNLILTGLLSIQKGDPPFMLREKLLAALPSAMQDKVMSEITGKSEE
ncbi:MAG: MotA/TolQ/ExbB proton channel family protein [Anaerovoracaceae bacterium]|jgi:chemotaxis protein MotA